MVHHPSPSSPSAREKQSPAEAAQEAAGRSRGGSIAGAGWSAAAATGAGGRHRVRGVHEQGGDHVEEQAPVSYPHAGTTQERRARLSLDALRWGGAVASLTHPLCFSVLLRCHVHLFDHLPAFELSFSCPNLHLCSHPSLHLCPAPGALMPSSPTGAAHSPSPLALFARCSDWRRAWLLMRRRVRGRSLGTHRPRSLRLHPLPHPSDPVCPRCPKDRACPSIPPGLYFEIMLPSGTFWH